VVEVPVREKEALDHGEIDPQPRRVLLPYRRVGPHVVEQRVSPVAAPPCDEDGEAVASATETIEHHLARMSRKLALRRQAREEACRLGHLRDARVDAGERVGLVVDDDRQPKFVQRRDVFRAHGEGKPVAFEVLRF
jgi:hypothetical protein